MNYFGRLSRLCQGGLIVLALVVPLAFVRAQAPPTTVPTGSDVRPATKACRFTCVTERNVLVTTRAPVACSCMVKVFTAHPETAAGAPSCTDASNTVSAACRTACQSACGSTPTEERCFLGVSYTPPACATTAPTDCEYVVDYNPDHLLGPSAADSTAPTCMALSADNPTTGAAAGSSATLYNPLGTGNITIPDIIKRILSTVLGIVGAIALLMFVYGGIRWIMSGGSEEGVKAAKTTIQNATIGLLMIFFSYIILSAFLSAFAPGA